MSGYYLGIDQGTTGVSAILFDRGLTPVSRGYREITQYYPNPQWVEHDPAEIFEAVCAATREALKGANAAPETQFEGGRV